MTVHSDYVSVDIESTNDIAGFQFDIAHDDQTKISQITEGSFLSNSARTYFYNGTRTSNGIKNVFGVTMGNFSSTGRGELAKIIFEYMNPASIILQNVLLCDRDANPVNFTVDQNIRFDLFSGGTI